MSGARRGAPTLGVVPADRVRRLPICFPTPWSAPVPNPNPNPLPRVPVDHLPIMRRMALLGLLLLGASVARAESNYADKCAAFIYLSYSGTVAGDAPNTTSHKSVNCHAWQQFIALNWPAAGGRFGAARDRSPVQWQTYPTQAGLFRPGALPPAADRRAPLPPACAARVQAAGWTRPEHLTVLQAPPGPAAPRPRLNFTAQAGTEAGQAGWLAAANDTLVWTETRVSPAAADFIVGHGLYDAAEQAVHTAAGHPVVLPRGEPGGAAGTVVLKAAWMEVPDPDNPKWAYFKLSDAAILDAEGSDCRLTPVALIGLHIIQKTRSQPSYFWATFEHIDNVPDENGPASGSFNLFDGQCRPRTVTLEDPRCLAGTAPADAGRSVTVGCRPNTRPPYHVGGRCPPPRAIQTTRVVPIQADVADANRTVQASIARAHPEAVWRYYKLINVQWSPSPPADPPAPAAVPARLNATFPAMPVSNTTMETYLQGTTCTACHVNGALAAPAGTSADFSFLFRAADRRASPGTPPPVRR